MVTAAFATWWPLAAPGAAVALEAAQLGVVVNTADPFSVEIGDYYVRRRGIPRANVVFVTLPTGQGEISRSAFEAARAQVQAGLPGRVQALALAWTTPFRVDCMSVTTAFAFGFDPAFCAQGCHRTRPSPYFDSPSPTPFQAWGMRPAMLLAGASVAEAKALIERFNVDAGQLPIVLCPGGQLLRNPSETELARCIGLVGPIDPDRVYDVARSEEHTSELQSQ